MSSLHYYHQYYWYDDITRDPNQHHAGRSAGEVYKTRQLSPFLECVDNSPVVRSVLPKLLLQYRCCSSRTGSVRDQGLGIRDQGLGSGIRDQGLGIRDQGLGLGIRD